MKKYWREIAAAAIILIFVGPSLWFSPTFEDCIKAIPHDAAQQHQANGLSFFLFFGGRWFGCLGPFVDVNANAIVALFTVVLAFSTILLWLHTKRLAEGADDQSAQMTASVAEAGKSAAAMRDVATAMATNVERLKESLIVQREMVDRQKQVTELQSRAYISIEFVGVVPQDPKTKIRFEPRVNLVNLGNTPAYNVRFAATADVLPFPLPPDFKFPLSKPIGGSFIGPRMKKICARVVPKLYPAIEADQIRTGVGQRVFAWGRAEYEDAFGITRFTIWGMSFYWLNDGSVMSTDTLSHNNSD
jgi:hypothetical protein